MSRIRRANTKPEKIVRSALHNMGYRFRIQLRGVPGRPDVAFPRRRKALFVHGCFWHHHEGCRLSHIPKTRSEFWAQKFVSNEERDQRLLQAAEVAGWTCLVIWECETGAEQLRDVLCDFLGPPRLCR